MGRRALQQQAAILAGVLAFCATGTGIASAQTVYVGPRVYDSRAYEPGARIYDGSLPPFEVMRIVRSTGLAPLSRPMRRGAYYEVIAANRAGGQMRVVVDAFAGGIVKVNPIMAGGPYGPRLAAPYDPQLQPPPRPVAPHSPAGAPTPHEVLGALAPYGGFDDGVPPVPPRNVPGARIATAPATTPAPDATGALPAAHPPAARTPMPRARPNIGTPEAPPALAAVPPTAAPAAAANPSVATPAVASSPLATAPPLAVAPPAAAPKATAPAAGAPSGEPKLVPVAPLE
jgi:hypothetical protein